jgi:hypothetical protein
VIVAAHSLIYSDEPEATRAFRRDALMCDDIESTVAELEAKGATFAGGIHDHGLGLVTMLDLPGEPRHPTAYDL